MSHMKFKTDEDIKIIREILSFSQAELADEIGVERRTIMLAESGKTELSAVNCNKLYNYAFKKDIRINQIKAMFYKEEISGKHKLLFHASKSGIKGDISPFAGRKNNDFGSGFYCGESYEQPISLISQYENSVMYILDFHTTGLKPYIFEVDRDWMLTIAYFRKTLGQFENHETIQAIINKIKGADYIIAPIADNRMFKIIDTFIQSEITDEQCKHCLAATNLGYQYVLLSEKATSKVKILEKCFVCDKEKEYYKKQKENDLKITDEKVKMARIKYKRSGQYIEEILK